jgi:D-aminopeptidase
VPIDRARLSSQIIDGLGHSDRREGGGMLTISLEGSVIGHVTKTNVMASEFGLAYKQSEGKQIPSAFIGGAEDVLTEVTRPIGAATKEEQVGLSGGAGITDGEALEIKARP